MADGSQVTREQQWLARRRELVTASDVAAILGFHPTKTAAAVYAEKLGHEPPETPAMRRGREHEALIAQEYAETTGRPVHDLGRYEIQVHADIPWLGATLDRVTACPNRGSGPLEIKRHLARARDWRDGIPLDVQVQLQVGMACYRAEWGAAAAEISNGPIVHFDHPREAGFVEALVPALEIFRRNVERRILPDVSSAWADRWALKALFPGVDGTTVDLDAEASALVDALEDAREAQRERQREVDAARNKLERAMGGAEFAYTTDGRLLTRAKTHRRAFAVPETDFIRLVVRRPRRRR